MNFLTLPSTPGSNYSVRSELLHYVMKEHGAHCMMFERFRAERLHFN